MIVLAMPWLLLLLPLPWAVRLILTTHHESRDAVYAPFVQSLAEISGQKLRAGSVTLQRTTSQLLLFISVWLLIVLSLARPQLIGEPIEKMVPTRDLLLAVDLSGSMDTEDFQDEIGNKVNRLAAVKTVLDDFLAKREGDRVGLIFFGSAAFLQAPFTEDLDTCRIILDEAQVRMAGPKTVVGDAIGLAVNVFESSNQSDRVLILLTDGNDTGSRVPPDRAAVIAQEKGITIHTVAVGDPSSVGEEQIDLTSLETIAECTGGEFAFANNRDELESVYLRLDEIETRDIESISYRPRQELFHWPIVVCMILLGGFQLKWALPQWLHNHRATSDRGDG
jgi:Ca-activated chloride channel homolog